MEKQTRDSGSKAGKFFNEIREFSTSLVGNILVRITRQGLWAGAARFVDAPFRLAPNGRVFIRVIEQSSQPTTSDIDDLELAIWVDSDDNSTYLITNQNSTIKKVQLT